MNATQQELLGVRDIIAAFLVALKNYALYPEGHAILEKTTRNVQTLLNDFLKTHEALRLEVEKDRLMYQGEVAYQGVSGDKDLPFLLFRDGIQWLEFHDALEADEIKSLLKIFTRFRDLKEEADGDLVTSLWEANFPHIHYKATDVYWESEPLIDLSLLNAHSPSGGGSGGLAGQEEMPSKAVENPEDDKGAGSIFPLGDMALLKLTHEETVALREMILEEEKHDSRADVLDVVLFILPEQKQEENLIAILDFLREEFEDALASGDFHLALDLILRLHGIQNALEPDKSWMASFLNDFFIRISAPDTLGALQEFLSVLDRLEPDQTEIFRRLLLSLPPQAIQGLGPMILEIKSSVLQEHVMNAIASLAAIDSRPFEALLEQANDVLIPKLLPVLKQIKGERPIQLLIKMTRHSSDRVRKKALKMLMARDSGLFKEIFPLIDDPNSEVRKLMLEYLGNERNDSAERLLIDYLEQRRFRHKDLEHFLACCRTLGRCGSSRSIPFLKELLLNQGWVPGLGRSMYREGAALALASLGTKEAIRILEKASRSLFPTVRSACRKVVEEKL